MYQQQPQQPQQNTNLLIQGRIVWLVGKTPFEGKALTDDNGRPVLDENGNQAIEYGFGLAVPKVDANGNYTQAYTEFYQAAQKEIYALYPSGQVPHDFAKKYKDGDTDVDQNGKPFYEREGYKGHIVIACKTRIPMKFFKFEGGNNIIVSDGFKNGDYVNVQLNIKGHHAKGRGKAGLYINPGAVQLIQAGKEIINSPSGDQLFGNVAPMYAGTVEAHVAPQMPGQNMMPPQNNMMPPQNNMIPPQNNMMPPQNNMMPPPQNNMMPPPQQQQAEAHYGVLPQQLQNQGQQNNMMPPQNNMMPPQNNMMPPQNNMMPPQNNMMPPQNNMMPPQMPR